MQVCWPWRRDRITKFFKRRSSAILERCTVIVANRRRSPRRGGQISLQEPKGAMGNLTRKSLRQPLPKSRRAGASGTGPFGVGASSAPFDALVGISAHWPVVATTGDQAFPQQQETSSVRYRGDS